MGLEDEEFPEALLLDITGCAHLFGGEESLARLALRDMTRLRLKTQAAIADTIGAAWAMTYTADRKNHRAPVVVPSGKQTLALQRLPVEALRLPSTVVETLRELDLRTIGQLQQLPRETLPSRFGSELLLRLDQALGNVPEMIVPEHPNEPAEARWGCEDVLDNALAIEAILRRLLHRVTRIAATRGEGILRLDICLTCVKQELLRISIGCLRPTLHRKHLMELIRLQLERVQVRQGIVDFLVRASVTAPRNESQPDLLGGREQRDHRRELDLLLNRLASRLGRAAVLQPELQTNHQPELAVAFHPIVGAKPTKRRDGEVSVSAQRFRPVRVLPQPVPVVVTSVIPDGPPIRLRWRNVEHRIVHYDGPERIETGWWRQAPIRRDYYRVDLDSGERYWLFRTIDNGHWFLHGDF